MDLEPFNNKTVIKQAYLYLRVSSEEQVTNFSLDNQLDYCSREASRQGYDIAGIYREEGASAKTLSRPQLIRLLEDCRTHKDKVSAIFIYKIDRISRETLDYLAFKKRLAGYGIRIISVTEPFEESPAGEFLETILAASATLDNAQKSQRTLDGMKKRLEAGYALGRAPVGYLNATINEKHVTIPDPEQFDKVKKAWEEMAVGIYTLESIVPIMSKLGIVIKIGQRRLPIIRSQQTHRLFRDKFYCGYIESKKFGMNKLGLHQPMISEELFYRVQAILNGRSSTSHINYKRQHEDFPLRGQALCGICSKPMTGSWSGGNGGKYAYYYCQHGHPAPSISKDSFETSYLKLVTQVKPTPELASLFAEMVKEKWQTRYSMQVAREKAIEDEIAALHEVRKNLTRKHAEGVYTDEVYKEQLEMIEDELLVKKSLKSEATLAQIDIEIVANFMKAFLSNPDKAWKEGTLAQRKALTGSMFPKNVIFDKGKFRTEALGPAYSFFSQFSTNPVSSWVADGIRTRDILLHKQALYR